MSTILKITLNKNANHMLKKITEDQKLKVVNKCIANRKKK